ncbi:MAG TPA: ferredoxin [Tenericutes bacterium]|nr:ferredoxin [Mycoplasmatota bacterium]
MEKVKVSKDLCIGCGACQAICPDVFEIQDDGLATVYVDEIPEELESDVTDAAEGCPTGAIFIDDEE